MLPAIRPEGYFIKSLRGIAPTKESHRAKLWNHFKKELKKYIDIADDLVPYCFRHTYCTDLQDAGVPINLAREFMGHSSITLTSRIYTHHSEKSFNNAKECINMHHRYAENSHINSHILNLEK